MKRDYNYFMEIGRLSSNNFDVVFVDGLWNSGKSLVAPLVSTFENVGNHKIDPNYEYWLILRQLEAINDSALRFLILTNLELSFYHNSIGREVNLRIFDDSSYMKGIDRIQTIMNLFSKNTNEKYSNYIADNHAFFNLSHMITAISEPFLNILGSRLKLINVFRNPLTMIEFWKSYFENFSREREGTVSFIEGNSKIPWFAKDWEVPFDQLSSLEKAIFGVSHCSFAEFNKVQENGTQILSLGFNQVVLQPHEVADQISNFLDRPPTSQTSNLIARNTRKAKKKNLKRIDLDSRALNQKYELYKKTVDTEIWSTFEKAMDVFVRRTNRE